MNGRAYFRNFTVCFYPVTSQDRNQFFTVNTQACAERECYLLFTSWTSYNVCAVKDVRANCFWASHVSIACASSRGPCEEKFVKYDVRDAKPQNK